MLIIYNNDYISKFTAKTRHFHYSFLESYYSRDDSEAIVREIHQKYGEIENLRFYLESEDGGYLPIEIQTDMNVLSKDIIFIEKKLSVSLENLDLCYETDVLSYGFCFPTDKVLRRQYLFDMQEISSWYYDNEENYPHINEKLMGYPIFGVIVPIEDLSDYILATYVYKPKMSSFEMEIDMKSENFIPY